MIFDQISPVPGNHTQSISTMYQGCFANVLQALENILWKFLYTNDCVQTYEL